jgi:hypothetical protein
MAWGVTVAGSYAYISDYGNGLYIVNVGDPEHPLVGFTSSMPPTGSAQLRSASTTRRVMSTMWP